MASPSALAEAVRTVEDFPQPGISFKDITPILADPELFDRAVRELVGPWKPGEIDCVAGIDARGFIFGGAVARELEAGFVPIRKKDKLPYRTLEESYDLEYGSNTLAIHADAVSPGARVLMVDDLLATGGTATAALKLMNRLEAQVKEVAFLIELSFLNGRRPLAGTPVRSLITY